MGMPQEKGAYKKKIEQIERYAEHLRCKICPFEGDIPSMETHFSAEHRLSIWPLYWARYVIVLRWRNRD